VIARFLSPDPLVATPLSQTSPLQLRAQQHPLKYVDPSGFEVSWSIPEFCVELAEDLESRDPDLEYDSFREQQASMASTRRGRVRRASAIPMLGRTPT